MRHSSVSNCRRRSSTSGSLSLFALPIFPSRSTELLFQFASILLIILGCWSIARVLFDDERAQWAGVALTAAMMTLPVAGTALYLADQHLAPAQRRHRARALGGFPHPGRQTLAGCSAAPALLCAAPHHGGAGHLILLLPDHGDAGTGARLAALAARLAGRSRSAWLDI